MTSITWVKYCNYKGIATVQIFNEESMNYWAFLWKELGSSEAYKAYGWTEVVLKITVSI